MRVHSFCDSQHLRVQSYLISTHVLVYIRVKSGNFGHQVNSDIHLQTVEIQMRRLHMSRLIRSFTFCLANYFYLND